MYMMLSARAACASTLRLNTTSSYPAKTSASPLCELLEKQGLHDAAEVVPPQDVIV